jgi:hypothetical protein
MKRLYLYTYKLKDLLTSRSFRYYQSIVNAKQWMINDIQKSIGLQESKEGKGAPNILIALGLSATLNIGENFCLVYPEKKVGNATRHSLDG